MNEQGESTQSRKDFLLRISMGVAGISALAAVVPIVSALLAPLLEKKKETWRTVGRLKDFPLQTVQLVRFANDDPATYAGTTAKTAAWLRRESNHQFIAFSANCTHLGCPVRWEENAELFMCPCHGGVYYKDGTVASGPPPEPLKQYAVRILNDEVQIRTAPLPLTTVSNTK